MSADLVKLIFTYLLALLIVVGGGLILYLIRLDPPESGSATLSLAIAGFMGAAIQFVFNKESTTQATRAAESSFRQGQPTVTTSSGPPATTTVTPQPEDGR